VSTFDGLKSVDALSTTQLQTHKAEILHRKLVSENEYATLIHKAQERDGSNNTEHVHLSEAEKASIHSAKEKFSTQSGTQFLFMRDHHTNSEHAKLVHQDLKADVEHNKDADMMLREENQHQLEDAAKVSNFHGLESTTALRTTVDVKEQKQVAESAKVTQFKGLQSTAKMVRTVEVDETIVASKLVSGGSAYEEALKKQMEAEEQKNAEKKIERRTFGQ